MTDADLVARRLSWVSDALHASAAIAAAQQVGLLAELQSGPASIEKLANACGTDLRNTGILLDGLEAMGLVSLSDGTVCAELPDLATLGMLATNSGLLAEAVRTGRAPLECNDRSGAEQVYPGTVSYLGALFGGAAREVAELLGPVERVLDMGAGAAPWSLAIAERNPTCRVTALDLDAVIPTTREAVAASGCADRFTYSPGDIFQISLPDNAYDLVLLGTCATSSTGRPTSDCYGGCGRRSAPAAGSRSSMRLCRRMTAPHGPFGSTPAVSSHEPARAPSIARTHTVTGSRWLDTRTSRSPRRARRRQSPP
jgi:O-methyltransferase domain